MAETTQSLGGVSLQPRAISSRCAVCCVSMCALIEIVKVCGKRQYQLPKFLPRWLPTKSPAPSRPQAEDWYPSRGQILEALQKRGQS